MTDEPKARQFSSRYDGHDENSEDTRPAYSDEGLVFDDDGEALSIEDGPTLVTSR